MSEDESVATVLTVYGIETFYFATKARNKSFVLQQSLPFTVLKPYHGHRRVPW